MATKARDEYVDFGRLLRSIRVAQGFTLDQVAAMSSQVAKGASARISQPYLSELERGLAPTVRAEKLRTLAEIYGVDPLYISDNAPVELRDRVRREDQAFRETVTIVDYGGASSKRRREANAAFSQKLPRLATDVIIPLGDGDTARAFTDFREALRAPLCAADLSRRGNRALPGFWKHVIPYTKRMNDRGAKLRRAWSELVEVALHWHLYECDHAIAMLDYVSAWTYRFPCYGGDAVAQVGVRFATKELAEAYDNGLSPVPLVRELRQWQIADLLYRLRPKSHPKLPPPPGVDETVRGCIRFLTGEDSLGDGPIETAGSVQAFISSLNVNAGQVQTRLGRAFIDAAPLIDDAIKRAQRQPDQAKPRRRNR